MPSFTMLDASTATTNTYPPGQCTWWANERYHQVTGIYVSWAADAHGWLAGAMSHGWDWSALPPSGTPCIIVLQNGVQGASSALGHVGYVESINSDGSVVTSDLNWGLTPAEQSVVQTVTFQLGAGVDFIWDPNAVAQSNVPGSNSSSQPGFITALLSTAQSSLNADQAVATTLVAIDYALAVTNPFDTSMQAIQQDTVGAGPASFTFTDPAAWIGAVGSNFVQDFVALSIRALFIIIGAIVIIKVISNFIDFDKLAQSGASIAQFAAMAGA